MSNFVTCSECGWRNEAAEVGARQRAVCGQCGALLGTQSNLGMNNPYQAPHGGVQPTTTIAAGGPTDRQFRIGAAIAVPVISLGMLLAFFVLRLPTIGGMVLVGLGWFAVFFGLAALVDPNIVRAAGKYGTHLSWHYKLVALLIGLAALACSLASSYFVLTR